MLDTCFNKSDEFDNESIANYIIIPKKLFSTHQGQEKVHLSQVLRCLESRLLSW